MPRSRRILARLGLALTTGLVAVLMPFAVGAVDGVPSSQPPASTGPCPSPGSAPMSPTTGEVALLPASDVTGERMFTLGGVAIVEGIVQLEVLQATRGWTANVPPPDGQAAWTFLVRFTWDGREPGEYSTGEPYYNAIGFSMRDAEGFEYPNLQSDLIGRQPALLYGTLAAGQSVQGWVTFHAPADTAFVELTYSPISDDRVFFRAVAP